MARLRRLVEDGLGDREVAGLGVRQPLREATVHGRPLSPELEAIFADELNVKAVAYTAHGDDEHEGVTLDNGRHRRPAPGGAGAQTSPAR